jgi:hypothetical protein
MLNKSIEKRDCENYLFEDYRSKSGTGIWILALRSSGRKRGDRGVNNRSKE